MFNSRIIVSAIAIAALCSGAFADQFSLAPNATFYRADASDTITNPAIIPLSSLSFAIFPGDSIKITRVGSFKFNSSDTLETGTQMAAMFSSSNSILSSSNQVRVTGAVDAGVDFVSPLTTGGLTTDVTQDFLVDDAVAGQNRTFSSVTVLVPAGATHLFVGVVDARYSDNVDTNGDYGFTVTAVPEPASLGLLGLGASALLLRRKRAGSSK